jgi:hypothetical protein
MARDPVKRRAVEAEWRKNNPEKVRLRHARYTGARVFSDEERAVIRERRKYQSATELAAVFETTPSAIGGICRGVFGGEDWRASVKIDPQDEWLLDEYRVAPSGGPHVRTRYLRARPPGRGTKQTALHRIIMQAPPGMLVDHINGDTFDNRRANLRICTSAENARNSRGKNGISGFKGVYPANSRWSAVINVDGRQIYLGVFASKEKAARAYDRAAIEHHGEFARFNFPDARQLLDDAGDRHPNGDGFAPDRSLHLNTPSPGEEHSNA